MHISSLTARHLSISDEFFGVDYSDHDTLGDHHTGELVTTLVDFLDHDSLRTCRDLARPRFHAAHRPGYACLRNAV